MVIAQPEKYFFKWLTPEQIISNRQVIVQAMEVLGEPFNDLEVYMWMQSYVGNFGPLVLEGRLEGVSISPDTGFILIATKLGVMEAKPGYWIVKDEKGKFWPWHPDMFKATYDAV